MKTNPNALFHRGPSITTRLVSLIILSLLLMTLDHRQHHLNTVRAILSVMVYPLQVAASAPVTATRWLTETLARRNDLLKENARLQAEHLQLSSKLQKLESLQMENARLRALLESSVKVGDRVLEAELMNVDLDPYRHRVVLNKGSLNDVYLGQPILDAHGVMGQVTKVSPLTAEAMLITDPEHAIPVQVLRTGMRTLVVGTGAPDRLELPHLPDSADIRRGDLLVTSGLGGRFPAGYHVGIVEEISTNPGSPFLSVTATPTAHVDRSPEVLLVWRLEHAEKKQEEPAQAAAGASREKETGQ
jgi:rod shape-determining protein MreC